MSYEKRQDRWESEFSDKMTNEQDIFKDHRSTMITGEQRDSIMYIIGKLDGIMAAGCSFDAEEVNKLLEPIRNDLSAIITEEEI